MGEDAGGAVAPRHSHIQKLKGGDETMEMNQKLEEYLDLFETVKARVGDAQVACEIVNQVGKDNRCALMRDGGVGQAVMSRDPDGPATRKQIGFLRTLGVAIPEGLTKRQASELIDQTAGK